MREAAIALAVVCVITSNGAADAADASAAEPARWLALKRGTDVRLTIEDGGRMREVAGRLRAADESTVTVETGGVARYVPRGKILDVRYRLGGRDRKRGAAYGAATTGLVGAAWGLAMVIGLRDENSGCGDCAAFIGGMGVVAAIPGAAIGFAIGAPSGNWRSVTPDGLTVAGRAPSGGARITLRWRPGRASRS